MHSRILVALVVAAVMSTAVLAAAVWGADRTAGTMAAPTADTTAAPTADPRVFAEQYVKSTLPEPVYLSGSGGFVVRASLAPAQLDPAFQARESDVVVWGTVVEVLAPRWNSPDGREWRGKGEEDMPIVYTTFLVEPREVMKGKPRWGTPIAFRTLGGIYGDYADRVVLSTGEFANVKVGDEIIVMGVDRPFYGGHYDVPAYWCLVNATSVYRGNAVEGFRRMNAFGGDPDPRTHLSLSAARSAAAF